MMIVDPEADMKIQHGHVNLNDTNPVEILIDNGDEVRYSISFSVQNIDPTEDVYIGGTGVTTTTYGIHLAPGAVASFENIQRNVPFYAVSSGNSTVAVMRMYS
jgi:hypothetical protein